VDSRNIAVLGLLILLFSSIMPWPFGLGINISLLSFYWGVIFAILSGFGLFGSSAFTITTWVEFAQFAALIVYPVGVYFAYSAIKSRNPSIYQGLGGIAGILMIASAFRSVPPFNSAEGAYVAILGGGILEIAYLISSMRGRQSSRFRGRARYYHSN
jgi:hypothetical protein